MHPLKGLLLNFYRSADGVDCTNGGISGRFTRCVLVGTVDHGRTVDGMPTVDRLSKGSQVFSPTADAPAVWLVMDKHRTGDRFMIPADPVTGEPDTSRWWMDGGNFASTSDSRFTQLTGPIMGVRVHDRAE